MFKYNGKEYIVKPIIRGEVRLSTKRHRLNDIFRECDENTKISMIDDIRDCIKRFLVEVGKSLKERSILFVKFICLEDGSEMVIRVGCPNMVMLHNNRDLSCQDCWNKAIGIFLLEENRKDIMEIYSTNELDLVTKFETREEKVDFLNNLKELKCVECKSSNAFKIKEKIYNMCPIDAGLENGFDAGNGCRFNCKECTRCWNKNIKDFLEDEE